MKTANFYIGGMTCPNCKAKIERKVGEMQGVETISVDYRSGKAEVSYKQEKVSFSEIRKEIEALDYTVSEKKAAKPDLLRSISYLIIIVSLFFVLDGLGLLTKLVPDRLAESGMGYGMLFVVGLITSVHCVAMCGGINLSQSLPKQTERSEFIPTLQYNIGRVVSYTVIGMILGAVGSLFGSTDAGVPVMLQAVLKIIAGIFMVIMGINMLGIFPKLKRIQIPGLGRLGRVLYKLTKGQNSALMIGLLNGFMPCGPMQAMWLVALVSGSPLKGGLSMLMFSLGTVPLMLGLGSMVVLLGKKFTHAVTKVGSVLVVVLGLAMLSQGGALSGLLNAKSMLPAVKADTVTMLNGVQYIESTLEPGGYPTISVVAGVPVHWTINAPKGSINGCNNKILIQALDMEYTFHEGENVIEFTPEQTGNIPYTCWMGMIRGNIEVKDSSNAVLQEVTDSAIPNNSKVIADIQEDNAETEQAVIDSLPGCCDVPDNSENGSCCGKSYAVVGGCCG